MCSSFGSICPDFLYQHVNNQLFIFIIFIKWNTCFIVNVWNNNSEVDHHLPMQRQVTSWNGMKTWKKRKPCRKNSRCWVRLFFGLLARLYSELPNEGLSPSPTLPHGNCRSCLILKCYWHLIHNDQIYNKVASNRHIYCEY